MPIVKVKDLYKSFGTIQAVKGISFEVEKGEIFGIVGPNGSGKTTTIEIIEGLQKPDKGEVSVLELNPLDDSFLLNERIGIQLQTTSFYKKIKVWEILELFASFYSQSSTVESILEKLSLQDKSQCYFDKLSGGWKQRVALAVGLINNPEILFLDEPTTGLDPQSRQEILDLIRSLKKENKTVIITTHYMEEAQQICDRVAIFNQGQMVALDTPEALIQNFCAKSKVILSVDKNINLEQFSNIKNFVRLNVAVNQVTIYTNEANLLIKEILNKKETEALTFTNIREDVCTLNDVFLTIVRGMKQ